MLKSALLALPFTLAACAGSRSAADPTPGSPMPPVPSATITDTAESGVRTRPPERGMRGGADSLIPPRAPVASDTPPEGLPGIPTVTNANLALAVVYPPSGERIAARDSNFILGSVGTGDATLEINGAPVEVKPNGAFLAWLPIPAGTAPRYRLIARRGADSLVLEHPVRTWRSPSPAATPPAPPREVPSGPVMLGRMVSAAPDTDRVINVRPVAGGTYKWFAIPGTVVERTGVEGAYTRIRLDSALEAYVATADVRELTDTSSRAARVRTIGNLVVAPDTGWTDVVFPMSAPPLYLVEEERDKLVLTLYSMRATTDIISYRPGASAIRTVTWEPVTSDRVRYVVHLGGAPFGYLAFFDGRAFRLRVRHPPVVSAAQPLAGITIAVDAGHPPVGSTGPTGLYEGVATLAISFALKADLERRGARVVMTRTTADAVDLMARNPIARRAGAHAFVSIHLNAVPDGVNPLTTHGTGTHYFVPHSAPLAAAVQAGMVESMGLRDLGVYYNNLAVVRATWMPAVLCEGAFAIIPEQEAAMRDPQGQRAYARGVADGIERYFRSLAGSAEQR